MWEKEETGLSYLDIPVIDGEIISEKEYKFLDVCNKKITIEEFVSSLSIEELAVLCNGYSTGKAFGGSPGDPKTIVDDNGNPIGSDSTNLQNDFISRSPAIKKRGIPSVAYKDGPAGIGYVAWPVGTMMASTWNEELLYAFGDAVGAECEYMGINVWLAPAINLHRNPIAGRNFEYYSEDPFLSGKVAVAVTNGVMENHHSVTVSAKHFVLNDQETYRRGDVVGKIDAVDSIAEERTIKGNISKAF